MQQNLDPKKVLHPEIQPLAHDEGDPYVTTISLWRPSVSASEHPKPSAQGTAKARSAHESSSASQATRPSQPSSEERWLASGWVLLISLVVAAGLIAKILTR